MANETPNYAWADEDQTVIMFEEDGITTSFVVPAEGEEGSLAYAAYVESGAEVAPYGSLPEPETTVTKTKGGN